jgi:hypothetical protein
MLSPVAERQTTIDEIVRCPVFKIDLKGRFVYVDDMTESLLRCPRDLLFGRSIRSYLSNKSFSIVQDIFQRWRHYETSFEAADLEIIDSDSERHGLTAVISLNFIAGNPANYQVVLIPQLSIKHLVAEKTRYERVFGKLFELVANNETSDIWEKLIEIIHQLDEVNMIGIYCLKNRDLNLLASSNGSQLDFKCELSPISEYHLGVALNGNPHINAEYLANCDDLKNNRRIFTEVCYPLFHGNVCWGMARFIISEDSSKLEEILMKTSRFVGHALYWFLDNNREIQGNGGTME